MDLNTNMLYEGTPNFSMRMTSIAAILVLHQLRSIEQKIEKFNQHYWVLNDELHNFTATIHFYNSLLNKCKILTECEPDIQAYFPEKRNS